MTAKKVLLISNEPNVREIVQACLTHLGGWDVIEASSAFDGLQRAVEDRPDAIILDLLVLGMDHITFLERLIAQPTIQAVPIVVLTVGARWLNLKRLKPFHVVGAVEYASDPTQLFAQIAKLLNWEEELDRVDTLHSRY